MRKFFIVVLILLIMVAAIPVAVIVFDAPTSPPAMASMATTPQINPDFPVPRHFEARDGTSLQYYAYPAAPDKVAVLIHGSAGPATSMHDLATALQAAGVTVYVPDIRGHGGSGQRGDIAYIAQLDDDLADFVVQLGHSNARLGFQKRGCSSLMTNVSYGRNYDYSPRRYDPTLVAIQPKGVHASLAFADRFTGRVDGMNEHGLCVGLHLVNFRPVRSGLACILIVRMVLDQCATTQEAVRLLTRIPHGQPFNYSLLDAVGPAAVVEASPLATAVRYGRQLACTNHFQTAKLARYNRQYAGSHQRLPPLETWSRAELSSQQLFAALNHGESPVFDHGYRSGSGTLHTFVCEPATRNMLVGIGGDASPRSIDFKTWTRGASLGFSQLEGQLGTRDRPFDPTIVIPTKKTLARRASVAADA
jgi:predicted choloylglycine hydrolase